MSHPTPTVLVPIDVSSTEAVDTELLEFLSPTRVVLLGWHPVPDQTATNQMRAQRGDEAVAVIESIATDLPEEMDVETTVVFTHDRKQTIDRIAEQFGCDVLLVPDGAGHMERVFVPIRSDINLPKILPIASVLMQTDAASCTLFHATPEKREDTEAGDVLLQEAAESLVELGVDPEQINTNHVVSDRPIDKLVNIAQNHDLIIIGETEPSLVERILGDVPTRVIDESGRPVLVVRDV